MYLRLILNKNPAILSNKNFDREQRIEAVAHELVHLLSLSIPEGRIWDRK